LKYLKLFKESFSDKIVFSVRDVLLFFSKQKLPKNYVFVLLGNLEKQGIIFRLGNGFYSFKNDLLVSGFAFSPFYYGLQESLSLRNLWEQESIPVIITPKKVRPGIRSILDSNVLIRHIDRKMFFGFDFVKQTDFQVPVSTPEKTLIDFIYFKEPLSSETAKEILNNINKASLNELLKKCSPSLKNKVEKFLEKGFY